MARLVDNSQIFMEMLGANASNLALTSNGYSMENCDKITFVVGQATAAAAATALSPTVQVIQSGDIGLSTNTSVTGLSTTLGPSTANTLRNVQQCVIDWGAAATNESLSINGYAFTMVAQSSLCTTVATALAYGSSVGSSANTGAAAIAHALSSVINASTLSKWITATTGGGTTGSVTLKANDTASTGIVVITTAASPISLTSIKAFSIFDVLAEDLNSTSKYVGISISTGATAARYAVTVIKSGLRNAPAPSFACSNKIST